MDENTVYQLFLATYHPSPEIHRKAEIDLKNAESFEGFLPTVLFVQTQEDYEKEARQAAAIYFKNRIYSEWESTTISNQDKAAIRSNIFQALMTTNTATQVHLIASLHKILCIDLPGQWPNFMQELEKYLLSDKIRGIHVGLIGLYELVKVYQWKSQENRNPLYEIVAIVFPFIPNIGIKLIELDQADILKLVLKIYHSSIQIELPPCFEDQATYIVPWCSLFIKVVEKLIVMLNDTTNFEKCVWWGTKKWAYRCLNLLVEKYSTQPDVLFMESFAVNILTAYLQNLDGWMKNEFQMSDKCLALSADFLCEAVKHKATWKIMKGYADILVSQFIFPLVCFSTKDELVWTENPIEYILKKNEFYENLNIPQQNVTLLLLDMITSRKKHTFMMVLNFVNSVLNREASENGRDKDGALYMTGVLAPIILESKSVAPMMEPFFINHVLPEFKSKFSFLRIRACELVRYFSELEFTDEKNLCNIYHQLLDCLRDNEIPVRVQAVLALQHLIRNEIVKDATIPHLPFIIQELISLMNQVDMDALVTALEEFMEIFDEQLLPFSVELSKQLSDTFLHLLDGIIAHQQSGNNEEISVGKGEMFNGKIVTALSVIETIQRLISDPRNNPDMLSLIELEVLPCIERVIDSKVYALFNEVFELVAFCILSAQKVSQNMWLIFEICYKAFKEDKEGLQYYASHMVSSLYNFVTLGKDTFIENENVRNIVFEIIDTCMRNKDLDENDRIPSCRLIESVLVNCNGRVDNSIPSFLNFAFLYILGGNVESIDFKAHCMEIVTNCIYYNPILTLGFLEEKGWTQGFFSIWFSGLFDFSCIHDKKLHIIALCSLLKLSVNQIPACLQQTWPQILAGVSHVFKDFSIEGGSDSELADDEEEEDDHELKEETDSDCNYENNSDDNNDPEDPEGDEDVEDEDAEYLEYLAQEAANDEMEEKNGVQMNENLYQSSLDSIDIYEYFEGSLKELQNSNIQFYDYLMKNISEEDQINIAEILRIAENNRTEIDTLQ